jgi:hypothetical protein
MVQSGSVSSRRNDFNGWRDRARPAILVDSDESERCIRDLLAPLGLESPRPRFDLDCHGCPADTLDPRVDTKDITYTNRTDEVHGVNCDCHHTTLRALDPGYATSLVHL